MVAELRLENKDGENMFKKIETRLISILFDSEDEFLDIHDNTELQLM